jgi:ADP-ribose pyrophosphatase
VTYEVVATQHRFTGHVVEVRTDTVVMPDGSECERDVAHHPGAAGAVAVNARGEVLLIRQYRHPLGRAIWEVPAGLCDVDGEDPLATARRELYEETGWAADTWTHLLAVHPTPGWADERFEVYLATDLREVPGERDLHGEEQDLELRWLPLPEAVEWVLDGRITNAMCVAGILAAARVRGV